MPASLRERIARRVWRASKTVVQKAWPRRPADQRYVFILGPQRSGTGMMVEAFDRSLSYSVFPDYDTRAYDNYMLREAEDIKALAKQAAAPIAVFKPMTDSHRARWLLDTFPNSQVIWLFRSMFDVVSSHDKLWVNMPADLNAIRRDPAWPSWKAGGMGAELHRLFQRHVHADMHNLDACAFFWFYRNRFFFEHGLDKDARCFGISYEKLVRHPERYMRALLSAMNLPYSPRMTGHMAPTNFCPWMNLDPGIQELCDELEGRIQAYLIRWRTDPRKPKQ